jgi:hypothetical protein
MITEVPDWIMNPQSPEEKPANPAVLEVDQEIKRLQALQDEDPRYQGVRMHLSNRDRYLRDKRDMQKAGDGDGSTRYGQYAGQEQRMAENDPNYSEYTALQRQIQYLKDQKRKMLDEKI